MKVWDCMAASDVGNLHFIGGTMDRVVDMSKQNLKTCAKKLGLRNNFRFQQDNDPKHSARATKEWILYNVCTYLNL